MGIPLENVATLAIKHINTEQIRIVRADAYRKMMGGRARVVLHSSGKSILLQYEGDSDVIATIREKKIKLKRGQSIHLYCGDSVYDKEKQSTYKVVYARKKGLRKENDLEATTPPKVSTVKVEKNQEKTLPVKPWMDSASPEMKKNRKRNRIIEDSDDSDDDTIQNDTKQNRQKDQPASANKRRKPPAQSRIVLHDSDDDFGEKKEEFQKAETIVMDKSDEDDEDEIEENEEVDSREEIQKVLQECEKISTDLTSSIMAWKDAHSDTSVSASDGNCISLTYMQDSSRITRQSDIEGLASDFILKDYQLVGINWLHLLYKQQLSGVLADDMGLGKTCQTVSFLCLLKTIQSRQPSNGIRGSLVIVPSSVLSNWGREIARFAPGLKLIVYHGTESERAETRSQIQSTSQFDVMLTTYVPFQQESSSRDRSYLRKFEFCFMVLDEGHNIKNSKTSRFRRIRMLQSQHKLILTGTPIQNNLQELITLLSFLMPNLFDSEKLNQYLEDDLLGAEEVKALLAPFILRRLKSDVMNQLPKKTIHVQTLELEDYQQQIYSKIVQAARESKAAFTKYQEQLKQDRKQDKSSFNRQLRQLCDDPIAFARNGSVGSKSIYNTTNIFTDLRKAANHPALLRTQYSDAELSVLATELHRAEAFGTECTVEMVSKELHDSSDFELHALCHEYQANPKVKALMLSSSVLYRSTKFAHLQKLLPDLHARGRRVLIFSQWRIQLDILQPFLTDLGYRFLRLDGSTKVSERQPLIDEFTEDDSIFVFLLSTRAGGLGINLTAADTVILHDLDFNPTSDFQAIDRVHRIGQTKAVEIYKLVVKDTVDERIFQISEDKNGLTRAILGGASAGKEKAKQKSMMESIVLSVLGEEL